MPVEIADAIIGRPTGQPVGTFGLFDLIGIDLMKDVFASLKRIKEGDPFKAICDNHPIVEKLLEKVIMEIKAQVVLPNHSCRW